MVVLTIVLEFNWNWSSDRSLCWWWRERSLSVRGNFYFIFDLPFDRRTAFDDAHSDWHSCGTGTCVAPLPLRWSWASCGQAKSAHGVGGDCGDDWGGAGDCGVPVVRSCSAPTGSSCGLVCLLYRTRNRRGWADPPTRTRRDGTYTCGELYIVGY